MAMLVKRYSRNGKRLKVAKETKLYKFLHERQIGDTPRLKRDKP